MSRRALLIGDGVVSTGFARMNHAYIDGLRAAGWDVSMLALNYFGDPHKYPYDIYPAFTYGQRPDMWGLSRLPALLRQLRPDLVCVTNDPWNIPQYRKRIGNTPLLASVAVDGKNCRGAGLNGSAMTVFWTQFGLDEAKLGGFSGPSRVIPLGIDLETYWPYDRLTCRQSLPEALHNAFVVGVVGRNQPRKRVDLSMIYFAEWIRRYDINDAHLFLHVGPTGEGAFDIDQLAHYLKISSKVLVADPEIGMGITEKAMVRTYGLFDVMLSTTQGEGWGLTHMEGMACGVPQILPDWSALSEWAKPAAYLVPCTSVACTPNGVNAVGGIADKDATIGGLNNLYRSVGLRRWHREAGLKLVRDLRYRWEAIGAAYAEAALAALQPSTASVALSDGAKVLDFGAGELHGKEAVAE